MIVKRFSGGSVEEALVQAKWELGDEAILLSSGPAKDRWWKFWERGYHVLAATDYPSSARHSLPAENRESGIREVAAGQTVPAQESDGPGWSQVMELLTRVDRKVSDGFSTPEMGGPVFERLVGMELPAEHARQIEQTILPGEEGPDRESQVLEALAGALNIGGPLRLEPGEVIAVIGPTGAGKTTTIAKLASRMRLNEGRTVLLITTDTFRVAAVEQLRTFAGILDVPVAVANRPQDIPGLIAEYQADVVFIDTPGHSMSQPLKLQQTRSVLKYAPATQVLLCMPANLPTAGFIRTAQALATGQAATICLTKADEVPVAGGVFGALMDLRWPLSYVAYGQNVPEDIQAARAGSLAQWMWEGGFYRG
jgi:flagellar biosynthesis protein FlhF